MTQKIEIKGLMFEGVDAVGKDTLIDAFNKHTNKKWFIINRGTGSLISYGKHYKRHVDFNSYYEMDNLLAAHNFVLVYLTANKKQIVERLINNKDDDITFEQIDDLKEQYRQYLLETHLRTVVIDTSTDTVKQSLDLLLNKLNKIGCNYYE